MQKHFILILFFALSSFFTKAQFKFGVAAGYEHTQARFPGQIIRSGGSAGGLLFRYVFSTRIEMDLGLSVGYWKTPFVYDALGNGPRDHTVHTKMRFFNFIAPVHICYIIPLKEFSLFAGPGFFWGMTDAKTDYYFAGPKLKGIGLSFMAGLRLPKHFLMLVDFRPIVNVYKDPGYFSNPDLSGIKNDWSVKIGYEFGKAHHSK